MTTERHDNQKSKSSEPGARIGTLLRGEVADAYNKRGRSRSDLILHYSGKAKTDVALTGELEHLHFLHAESDPDVVHANYSPSNANTELVGKSFASLVHAVVKKGDGNVIWRRLVRDAPSDDKTVDDLTALVGKGPLAHVSKIEVWTKDRLIANPTRLRNAFRAMGWITAARFWPLSEQKAASLRMIRKNRFTTFEEILSMGDGPHRALFGAAVLELAHGGGVLSDMNMVPLHRLTVFRCVGD